MASLSFHPSRNRWRIRWYESPQSRRDRWFITRDAAVAFAETVGGVSSRPGPPAHPMTPEGIRLTIRDRTVTNSDGCWVWVPEGGNNGYAQMTRVVDGRVTAFSVHRLSYEAFVGPIPDGLQIDHLCRVTRCVNPAHLEPVTAAENVRRRDERRAVSS